MPARHRSRRRALQVLFEWDLRGGSVDTAIEHFYGTLYTQEKEDVESTFSGGVPPDAAVPDPFMEQLAHGTAQRKGEIDALIEGKSQHWRIARMPAVDRNILRLAIYEMRWGDMAAPVAIDEAMKLAKQFSGDDSLPFINGVLDAVHRDAAARAGGSA